jgi:hypothetical protein
MPFNPACRSWRCAVAAEIFRELAEYGGQPHAVVVKEETLIRGGFGVNQSSAA